MKRCYIVYHIFHNMYSDKDEPVVFGVYESEEDANRFCVRMSGSEPSEEYFYESEDFFEKEPDRPKMEDIPLP